MVVRDRDWKNDVVLDRKLCAYAAMTGAAMAVGRIAVAAGCAGGTLTGTVCYTDITDAVLDVAPENVDVDFDGDGDEEVRIEFRYGSSSYGVYQFNQVTGDDSELGYVRESGNPDALVAGETIDGSRTFSAGNRVLERADGLGNWGGAGQRYLGVQIQLDAGATTHYGWVRLETNADGSVTTVYDYAYNTVADAAIDTGQTVPVELQGFSVE